MSLERIILKNCAILSKTKGRGWMMNNLTSTIKKRRKRSGIAIIDPRMKLIDLILINKQSKLRRNVFIKFGFIYGAPFTHVLMNQNKNLDNLN